MFDDFMEAYAHIFKTAKAKQCDALSLIVKG